MPYPLSDLVLARRIELAEASANIDFVEARASIRPQSNATWIERAGARAMFDGIDSPLTQTFGLGIFEEPDEEDLKAIETFFEERGAQTFHEVSPLVSPATIELLNSRGYEPFEFSSMLYQPINVAAIPASNPAIEVSAIPSGPSVPYDEAAAEGWSEFPEVAGFMQDIGAVTAVAKKSIRFLATIEGHPMATGILGIYDNVAILAGASTRPSARNQGAQLALLAARLRYAAARGCDLAIMAALPGSGSQRNAERRGFRIAYTRIKWRQSQRKGSLPG